MKKFFLVVALLAFITVYFGMKQMKNNPDLCFFGKNGDGNITTTTINLDDFTALKATQGLTVNLHKAIQNQAIIKIDSNLSTYINTKVVDNQLTLNHTKNICPTSVSIDVYYSDINTIIASAGGSIVSSDTLNNSSISVTASSGGDIQLPIKASSINLSASSGSNIDLTGKATTAQTSASSGASIDIGNIQLITAVASASSGGDIDITAHQNLNMSASSGGNISYATDTATIVKNVSSGGNIRN